MAPEQKIKPAMASRAQVIKNIFAGLILISIVSGLLFVFSQQSKNREIPAELMAVMRPIAVELKPFSLLDHNNIPFSLDRLKGHPSLLFFGYTSCPDICPTTLNTMNLVINKLKQQADEINQPEVIFVSVDTQRDDTETLAGYTTYFNKDFMSVTGEKQAIDSFAKQFAAAYVIENRISETNYQISHTSSIFLIDKDAHLIAAFSPPHDVATLVEQYRLIDKLYMNQ